MQSKKIEIMEAKFTIDNSYNLVCETGFFYLWHFKYSNIIAYVNLSKKVDAYKISNNCVGVWKLKQLK
jgi:hypothetical protein